MMPGLTDRPGYRLTRHFFQALFDLPFLSEGAGDGLLRTASGTIAGIFAVGLIVVFRLFVAKYGALAMAVSPEPFRLALLGDDALFIGVAMLVAALATVIVSASLFPDETDFRVRSPLHQGIWLALVAGGAALVINALLRAGLLAWITSNGSATPRIMSGVTWAPFAFVFSASLAARAALVIPVDRGANWIFRLTESPEMRVPQMAAVEWTLWRLGVGAPIILLLPLLWRLHDAGALVVAGVAGLCGLVLVQLLLTDWRRIPFSCSYLPGKNALAQTLLTGVMAFTIFTIVGRGLVSISLVGGAHAAITLLTLAAIAWRLRRQRRAMWAHTPLMFEDELPSGAHPVRLSE
jgi:hypothetical protein